MTQRNSLLRHVPSHSGKSSQWTLIGLSLLVFGSCAQAQMQRSFVNGGFELPALPAAYTGACYVQLPATNVPGWKTTHPVAAGDNGGCPAPLTNGTGNLIELWANNFNGVTARSGKVHAELNAQQASTLYQSLCLNTGDQVSWKLSHRGRSGTDNMQLYLGAATASGLVLDASTSPSGAASVNACNAGTNISGGNTCTSTTTNSWGDYAGTFTWTGAAGSTNFNFAAVGGDSTGNFLDALSVRVVPFVEFSSASASGAESIAATTLDGLKVSGELLTPLSVSITVTGGTATLGQDYTTPSGTNTFTVTIPAGTYDGTSSIPLGIQVTSDAVVEGDETITMAIVPNPTDYRIQSTSTCGPAGNSTVTYTILDDDTRTPLPAASDDSVVTPFETAIIIHVVDNDVIAPAGATFNLTSIDLGSGVGADRVIPGAGTFHPNGDGTVTFTPVAGFSGIVPPITYTIKNNNGDSTNAATISVTVRPASANGTPRTVDDTASTLPGVPVGLPVLSNDVAGVGIPFKIDSLTVSGTTPAQGSWTVNPVTGIITFTPAPGFVGTATANYTVTDLDGKTSTAVMTVTVAGVAAAGAASIPTLSEWGTLLLSAVLAALGMFWLVPMVKKSGR